MLNYLTYSLFVLSILLGWVFPRRAGWVMIATVPLLGPVGFMISPSTFFPLTMHRIAFGVTVGALLRNNHNLPIRFLFKSFFVKMLLIFSLLLLFVSLEDGLMPFVSNYLTRLISSILLCFIIVRDDRDIRMLVKIFVAQAAIISLFVILEYFTHFSIYHFVRSFYPEFQNFGNSYADPYMPLAKRGGFFRPDGLDGCAVHTSYRLIFFLPLTLWYTAKGKFSATIPLICTLFALILLQTRASIFGFVSSFLMLVIGYSLIGRFRLSKKLSSLLKMMTFASIGVLVLISVFPTVFLVGQEYIQFFLRIGEGLYGETIASKVNRIPLAFEYFLANPLFGYGSPRYVYSVLMWYQDLPSPFIYLLAGGALMCISYLIMIFSLPLGTLRLIRFKALKLDFDQALFLVFSTAAFMGGIVVVFFNWCENHFTVMYMLYISIYKVYYLKKMYGRSYADSTA